MLFFRRRCSSLLPSKTPPPPKPLQRLKTKFADAGLEAQDLVPALAVHELLGAAMALGFWCSCYALQPSSRLGAATKLTPPKPLAALYSRSLEVARKRLSGHSSPSLLANADPARATVSLAESLVLRATLKPATFVFKIWASAATVSGVKRVLRKRRKRGEERKRSS